MQSALAKRTTDDLAPFVAMVSASVNSPHTRRAYERNLNDFLAWFEAEQRKHAAKGEPFELNKATVYTYRDLLRQAGVGRSSINQRLTAIRRLATELSDNAMLNPFVADGIGRVKGLPKRGKRMGNWLTQQQAQQLLDMPDTSTMVGLRDRALLAVAVGCGLRRQEIASLTLDHIQQREGRWCIVDLVGKRDKVRTVSMAPWVKSAVDDWISAAGLKEGSRIFLPVNRGDNIAGASMTDQAVYYRVKVYTDALGVDIAPHDLRRTFAKLARSNGATLEQISLELGHDSIATTQRYLGEEFDFQNGASDKIQMKIKHVDEWWTADDEDEGF